MSLFRQRIPAHPPASSSGEHHEGLLAGPWLLARNTSGGTTRLRLKSHTFREGQCQIRQELESDFTQQERHQTFHSMGHSQTLKKKCHTSPVHGGGPN